MAEHEESLFDQIKEKFHGADDSSSSDDEKSKVVAAAEAAKAKIFRLFGREKPVHQILGGGKPADIFLWKDKKASAAVLGGATAIWILFELVEYHLLTLVSIPEKLAVDVALALRYEINRGLAVLREIASGRDLKKFLVVIAGLWVLSVIGNCTNFVTLFYFVFVTLHSVPFLYNKYEDQVDAFAEKATIEFKKHYTVIHAKYLSQIPRGPLKDKKFQ